MRIATFDVETARILPGGISNLMDYMPLGISCAAVALSDGPTELWQGVPSLSRDDAVSLVRRLQQLVADGYTLVTWNGCSFDFRVLAAESGMAEACGRLALYHCDLMAVVVCAKGHRLSLQKALDGAQLAGKTKDYRLPDGSVVDPSGANAPVLWDQGHYDAVITYLKGDVELLRDLALVVAQRRSLQWTSNRGLPQSVPMRRMLSVLDAMALPLPDSSWMTDPPQRSELVAWMPDTVSLA